MIRLDFLEIPSLSQKLFEMYCISFVLVGIRARIKLILYTLDDGQKLTLAFTQNEILYADNKLLRKN